MQPSKRTRGALTESFIKRAFLEILDQKDYSQITVREICEHAGIHRTTFYSHYHRIDDVLKDIVDEVLHDATISCWDSLIEDKPLPIMPLCEFLRKHAEYRSLFVDSNTLSYFINASIAKSMSETRNNLAELHIDPNQAESVLLHLIHGCVAVTLRNVEMPEDEWQRTRSAIDNILKVRHSIYVDSYKNLNSVDKSTDAAIVSHISFSRALQHALPFFRFRISR